MDKSILSQLPPGIELHADDPEALEDPGTLEIISQFITNLDANPLNSCFPYPKQVAFLEAKVRRKVFLGGNRAGKSSTWIIYVLVNALPKEMVPPHLLRFRIWDEPIRVRVVTPDYGRTFKSIVEVFNKWVPESALKGGSWEHGFADKDKQLSFECGSFIEFMTLEQDVNKFGGSPRHVVVFDEEPKGEKGEEIHRQCVMRLADFRGEEIFAFTPVHGLGWTFDDLWEAKGEEVAPEVWRSPSQVLVQASIHDNPFIDPEGKREALEKLPEKVRAAYESGSFIHFQGLVYDMFSPDLHLEHPPSPEEVQGWLQVDAIDPGQVTNANLFGAFDRDGVLHIYDELTLTGTAAVPEQAAPRIALKRASWGLPEHPKYRIIDPSAASRQLDTGQRLDMAYKKAGLRVLPAQDDRETGIFEVWRRMEHRNQDGSPKPLLKISTACVNTIKELGKYRLEPKEDGSFGVVKRNDHHMDAMRYIAMTHAPKKTSRPPKMREEWVPGTAPAHTRQRKPAPPMGIYS